MNRDAKYCDSESEIVFARALRQLVAGSGARGRVIDGLKRIVSAAGTNRFDPDVGVGVEQIGIGGYISASLFVFQRPTETREDIKNVFIKIYILNMQNGTLVRK